MTSSNFLDANVWLALFWNGHVHFDRALTWFQRARDEQFYFCRVTQLSVLRLLTTVQVMGKDVCSMSEAWKVWDRALLDDRIQFLSEPHGLETDFRAYSRLPTASPKVWADAYLLAFAAAAGLKLVTFDRALEAHDINVLVL